MMYSQEFLPHFLQFLGVTDWQNQVVKKASWMEELRKNNLQWFTETISMFSFLPISVQLSFILC